MKRKTSNVPCRVYRYGLLPPETRDVVDEQIWLAHRYYNDLIEVEHASRQAYVWARSKVPASQLSQISKQLEEERKDVCNARVRDPGWGPGLRGTCGLYSGTYLLIESQAEQACKKPGAPPRFRRWEGEGAIGVQCSKPIPVAELLAGTHRLAAVDTGPRMHCRTGRPVKNGVWLTVPVGPNGVRARFPMVMHRQMPPDGIIRWIKIIRRRLPHGTVAGTRERWEAHITVEAESFARPARQGPAAAIDLCWSKGRVGHLLAADGHEESVRPDKAIVEKLSYANSVRKTRDGYINVAKEWAALNIDPRVRSWQRMHARGLIRKMREWEREGHNIATLEAWRRRDDHLRQIEYNVRAKAKRRLINDYRVWARRIVDTYPVIFVEDMDLSVLAEKKAGGPMRFAYAPSHLRDALLNAGAQLIPVPTPGTSRRCNKCGHDVSWSSDYHRPVCTSASCGWKGDRRVNAVRNIFASGLVALNQPVPVALRGIIGDLANHGAPAGP